MAEWLPSVLIVVVSGTLLIFILRNINAKVDKKVDISACNDRFVHLCKDLDRGEKSFDVLRSDIVSMTTELARTNVALALITQKIDIYLEKNGIKGK